MEIREKLNIYFELVGDSRHRSYITYKMSDILFMLICGTLCGLVDAGEIIEFVEEREGFFLRACLRSPARRHFVGFCAMLR